MSKCCIPSSSTVWRWRCDRGVLRPSRPAEKRPRDLNSASRLRCTLHEHRVNRGPRFEEIEEKLPSNWVFSSSARLDFQLPSPGGKIFALFLPPPYRLHGRCRERLQTVRSVKVRQHHPASTTKRYSQRGVLHVLDFLSRYSTVGAPSYPATTRVIKVPLVAWCRAHGRSCGCEISGWCANQRRYIRVSQRSD